MEIILGLDISTTTIGISLVKYETGQPNTSVEIILLEGLVLKNKDLNKYKGIESLCLKNLVFEEKLKELKEVVYKTYNSQINKVIIEEALLGSNNINTVGTLLKFNGIISNTIYTTLGIVPEYLSSYESRCYAFPQLMEIHVFNKKNERRDKKEVQKALKDGKLVLFGGYPFQIDKKTVIQELIAEKFPNIEWLYDKKGNLIKSSFDSTDALAVILGYINKVLNNGEKPVIVDVDETDGVIKYTTRLGKELFSHKISFC